MNELDELVVFIEDLADVSRSMLHAVANEAPTVSIKSDSSYVTDTDKAIETRLRALIEQRYPGHGIMGEEFGSHDLDAEYVWVLDPIDGTAPFVAGIPVYGSLIGLARGGVPWLGVIEHPATHERWLGIAGERSFFNGKPIRTRSLESVDDALMTCSNPDFFTPSERRCFDRLRGAVRYTQYGGSCYAYGVLASGRTDIAIDGGLDPVDIFASAAVITGAGGTVSDWNGNPITLDWHGLVVASGDQSVHNRTLELLEHT
jgi:histidinol phosphatase-like enzyme (inositol monophosphatase family)